MTSRIWRLVPAPSGKPKCTVLHGKSIGCAVPDEDWQFGTSGVGLRRTSIRKVKMNNFTSERQWFCCGRRRPAMKTNDFALADKDRQFWSSGVWGLDALPLRQPKCTVLHWKSIGFAMAGEDRQFWTSRFCGLDAPHVGSQSVQFCMGKTMVVLWRIRTANLGRWGLGLRSNPIGKAKMYSFE